MTKSPKISLDSLTSLRSKMTAMPPKIKQEYTTRETVQSLEPEIRSLITDRGYSLVDVARMLAEDGLPITSSSLAAYLRDLSEDAGGKKKAAKAPARKSSAIASKGAKTDAPQAVETHTLGAGPGGIILPATTSDVAPATVPSASPMDAGASTTSSQLQKNAELSADNRIEENMENAAEVSVWDDEMELDA